MNHLINHIFKNFYKQCCYVITLKTNTVGDELDFRKKKYRSSHQEVFCEKGVLRNFAKFTGKHLCQSLFFNKAALNFIKKETLAQVFSCEFCEISKNAFSYRTPPVAASKNIKEVKRPYPTQEND